MKKGYKPAVSSGDASFKKNSDTAYTLTGTAPRASKKATYEVTFTKGDQVEKAKVKVDNKKAYTAHQEASKKENAEANETKLSYAMLNKSQSGYKGQPYKISDGYVMQAMEDNGQTFLLVQVTNLGDGYYDDIVAVLWKGTTDAVEGDVIEVYGTLGEKYDYNTQIGGTNSVPMMEANTIKVLIKGS